MMVVDPLTGQKAKLTSKNTIMKLTKVKILLKEKFCIQIMID